MSFFDPQHVYRKGTFYTKKGQIIQKRPVNRDGPLSVKDRDKAIRVVKAFGYNVFPPGESPESVTTIYETSLSLPFEISQTSINLNNVNLTFNQLFSNVGNVFDSVLLYYDKAIDVSIDTYINSMYIRTTGSGYHNNIIQTSKLSRTIQVGTGDATFGLMPKNLNQYFCFNLNSNTDTVSSYNYDSSNSLNVLGYHNIHDLVSLEQLATDHQIDEDFDVLQVSMPTNGTITDLYMSYNISIRVQYLDDVEPYS